MRRGFLSRQKKERTKGKEIYTVGETVRVQNIKIKKWDATGVILKVRTADNWTILSYEVNIDGVTTSRHRRYLCKIRNSDEATVMTEEENRAGASAAGDSSQQ